jgi:hypothetical protein
MAGVITVGSRIAAGLAKLMFAVSIRDNNTVPAGFSAFMLKGALWGKPWREDSLVSASQFENYATYSRITVIQLQRFWKAGIALNGHPSSCPKSGVTRPVRA